VSVLILHIGVFCHILLSEWHPCWLGAANYGCWYWFTIFENKHDGYFLWDFWWCL